MRPESWFDEMRELHGPLIPDSGITKPGATWFRRGYQSSTGHAKVQSPCKSAGNTTNANDERFALAA